VSDAAAARERPAARRAYLLLAVAVIAVSTGSLFIRKATAPPVTVAFYRIGLAALLVAPFVARRAWPAWRALTHRDQGLVLVSGVALALHFATWIASLSYTSVAASVLLVNTAPVFTLGLAWMVLGEPPTPTMLMATGLALAGAALIAAGDWTGDLGGLRGHGLALAGAATLSAYHVIGRGLRAALPLDAYILGVWATAAGTLALLCLGLASPLIPPPTAWPWLVALALVPTVCGHGLVNAALRHLPAPSVGLFLLGEPLGAALLALAFLGEVPGPWTLAGGVVVLLALALLVRGDKPFPRPAPSLETP
jgi:drug/metabolite transporter (DMT)-like permease